MSNRSRILLALVLIALLGAFASLLLRPREPDPLYQGKPLTYWLQGYRNNSLRTNLTSGATRNEARYVVRQLGTNAIPTLLHLLKTRDDPLMARLWQLIQRQHLVHVQPTPPQALIYEGFEGLQALGVEGRPAIPQLLEIYDQNPNTYSRQMIPALLANLYAPDRGIVPLLVRATTDTNDFVRLNSIMALGSIHAEPDLAVPALIKCLSDPFDMIRMSAAHALGAYRNDAQPAVPALLKLFKKEQADVTTGLSAVSGYSFISGYLLASPSPVGTKSRGAFGGADVLTATTDALQRIDPQAAAQAGIK